MGRKINGDCPRYPKKPVKAGGETDEQFSIKLDEYSNLIKIYKREYSKFWRDKNPEKVKALREANYKRNSDKIKARTKRYREQNPDKVKIFQKSYKEKFPEKIKQNTKEYNEAIRQDPERHEQNKAYSKLKYLENTEERKAYRKKRDQEINGNPELLIEVRKRRRVYRKNRFLTDPVFAASMCLRDLLRHRVNRYLNGKKDNSALDLIGCTVEEFVKHISDQFVEGMTWTPKNFHLDHIRPCASFDLTDPSQLQACFHYSNYQPLWPTENLQKNAQLDWKRE